MKIKKIKSRKVNRFLRISVLIALVMILQSGIPLAAQYDDVRSYEDLERITQKNYDYLVKINEIIGDYPNFAYSYKMKDGKVSTVTVKGVDNDLDKEKLTVVLLDLESNKNMIKNKANRIGVFYSVDQDPAYASSRDLQKDLLANLEYPEDAEIDGVEGTIYVKFVVDENGKIPFASVAEDIESSSAYHTNKFKNEAIEAVKATSGNWTPGKIDGVKVPSLVILPVTFDFKKHFSVSHVLF